MIDINKALLEMPIDADVVYGFISWIHTIAISNSGIYTYKEMADNKFVNLMISYVCCPTDISKIATPTTHYVFEQINNAFMWAPDSIKTILTPLVEEWKKYVYAPPSASNVYESYAGGLYL